MNKFINAVSNLGYTENGALTHTSTGSAVLNLFSMGGAIRSRSDNEIMLLIENALKEDTLLALKCLFYLRDVRSGQGERKVFRLGLKVLEKLYPEVITKNMSLIPEYGRWDDLYSFDSLKTVAYDIMLKQLFVDISNAMTNKPISLLSKWMKSINASSIETRKEAKAFCKFAKMPYAIYRKRLSMLRKYNNVLEVAMSNKKWESVNYEHVPSLASMKYRKAFSRHDETRYAEYLSQVKSGEKKMNASVTYPSDIVKKIRQGKDETLEMAWKSLPNYITEGEQALVVCDTSGSMTSTGNDTEPIDVALALSIYFAERNTNPEWKDYYITFSSRAELRKITGDTLYDKADSFVSIIQNTNIQSVFDLILTRAKAANLTQVDMPNKLYFISDMEFDSACKGHTNFEVIKQKYLDSGYIMPKMIFWNVASRNDNCPVTMNENGVALVSGYSPSIFKNLLGDKDMTPYTMMLEVLDSERYKALTI